MRVARSRPSGETTPPDQAAAGTASAGVTRTPTPGLYLAGFTAPGGDQPRPGQAAERTVAAQQLDRLEQRRADAAPGDCDSYPAERRPRLEAQPLNQSGLQRRPDGFRG